MKVINGQDPLNRIENIVRSRGMENEQAFKDITFYVEPLPCLNGNGACPIGLYLYKENKIFVSPGFSDGTVLHELGHRYGHYYYNDLSESYAESFRKGQMVYLLPQRFVIGEGSGAEMAAVDWAKIDVLFTVGDKGEFVWRMDVPITAADVTALQEAFFSAGLSTRVTKNNSTVTISFTQLSLPFFQTVSSLTLPVFESGSTINYFIVYKLEGSWFSVLLVFVPAFLLARKFLKKT